MTKLHRKINKLVEFCNGLNHAHERGERCALDSYSRGYHKAGQYTIRQVLDRMDDLKKR